MFASRHSSFYHRLAIGPSFTNEASSSTCFILNMDQPLLSVRVAHSNLHMKYIYLDHAASSPVRPEVLHAMMPYLRGLFGNPSSLHFYGREARIGIEESRITVARLLGVKPSAIFFTSGGTESNNTAIYNGLTRLECKHIITSAIEHHAVLHGMEHWGLQRTITRTNVQLTESGTINYDDLERQLYAFKKKDVRCFVSLMAANNETGALLDIEWAGRLCERFGAIFHSDGVQTVGHYPVDFSSLTVKFASASAHKFGGPKGIGMLYVKEGSSIQPLLQGGRQERGQRPGTENVAGIVGFAKALEIALRDYEKNRAHIQNLKEYLAGRLKNEIPGVSFNGCPKEGLYTILSVNFPRDESTELLVVQLDQKGICVSGGAACNGASPSHVMKVLDKDQDYVTVRFSFNEGNTLDEMERVVRVIRMLQDGDSSMVAI